MNRSLVAATLCAVFATPLQAASLSDIYTSYFAFGDSLSDDGNTFDLTGTPPEPYFDGRFSNGLLFTDLLAQSFSVTENFAFGGATAVAPDPSDPPTVPSFEEQVDAFLGLTPVLDEGERPLVTIWSGANDILQALSSGGDLFGAATSAALAVVDGISELAADEFSAINDFVVMTLPDIGLTAQFATLNYNNDATAPFAADLQAAASFASQVYNQTLLAQLGLLEQTGLNILTVDTGALLADLTANPELYGLINVTDPCLYTDAAELPDEPVAPYCGPDLASQYLYFDGVHPNSTAHKLLADEIRMALVPLPGTLPLLAGALLGAGLVARRRKAA